MRKITASSILFLGLLAFAILATSAYADTCYQPISDQVPKCVGGKITSDEYANSCREFVCESSTASMTVKACDKPSASTATTELYKIFQAGTGLDFCLGDTCLAGNGFARSDTLQLCSSTGGSGGGTPQQPGTAAISIDPLFPQGPNYVLNCNVSGLTPTSYSWNFGDGTTAQRPGTREEPYLGLPNSTVINNNVFHTYPGNGTYTTTCTASNGSMSATAQRTIEVRTPVAVSAASPYATFIEAQQLANSTYQLSCIAIGFPADVAWRIANASTTLYDSGPYGSAQQRSINFTFPAPGAYFVSCSARTYDDRYRKDYYDPNFIPSSSSFGTIATSADTQLLVGEGAQVNGTCTIASQTPTCVGGQLASSNRQADGCWEYTCLSGASGTMVKACEKPGSNNPAYFELYRISSVGSKLDFCLGSTCLGQFDFARSSATCSANQSNSAQVLIAPYYPKEKDYVFVCDAKGLPASSFDFDFGDGSKLESLPFNNTFHRYAANGSYLVSCTAKAGLATRTGSISISVGAANITNQTGNQSNSTCYTSVDEIPVQCTGGTVAVDTFDGTCRQLGCSGAEGNISVLACDKPSAASPSKFEMYRQSSTGQIKLCLGQTCISENGFASSTYPYCVTS